MRYDHRGSRGGRRPARGRPARDRYARDEYDEEDEYDDYGPPPVNYVPWIVVGALLVLAVVVVIMVAGSLGGGGEEDGSGKPGIAELRYGTFGSVRYGVKFTGTGSRQQGAADPVRFSYAIDGYLTVNLSGGGGSATLEVVKYREQNSSVPRQPSDCLAHGQTVAFQIGPLGGYQPTDESPDTHPIRCMLGALFPDLPGAAVPPGDPWEARSVDSLFSALPLPGPGTPDIREREGAYAGNQPGVYGVDTWAVSIRTPRVRKIGGNATIQGDPARFAVSSSTTTVIEIASGVPLEGGGDYDGFLIIRPDGDRTKFHFKYEAQLRRQ